MAKGNGYTTITGTDGNGVSKTVRVRTPTAEKVEAATAAGATIIINCNKDFVGRGYGMVEKLAHTTPKVKGGPHHIVYACYQAEKEELR